MASTGIAQAGADPARPAPYWLRSKIAAGLVAAVIILLQLWHMGLQLPRYDALAYLTMARDVTEYGVFSDGPFADNPALVPPKPGRFFMPAYPFFVAAVAKFDPQLRQWVGCQAGHVTDPDEHCPGSPRALVAIQIGLSAAGMACIFAIALTVSGSPVVAWLAMLIALATGEPATFAGAYLTETTALAGFYLFLAAFTSAIARERPWVFAVAGAGLGLALASRPSYLYLIYAITALLAVRAVLAPGDRKRQGWLSAAAFSGAGLLVVGPWLVRNILVFGDPALASGYGGFILVQRLAYNLMTWREWAVFWIYGLPDFGHHLASRLFPHEWFARFEFENPDGFYQVGNGPLRAETLAAAGGREQHLGYLIHAYLIPDLVKHVLVTLPLTLSGIWVGKYLGLAGVIFAWPVGRQLHQAGKLPAYLALVLPLCFMALFHGFVSVNASRYNLPFLALYGVVDAFVLIHVAKLTGLDRVIGRLSAF